MNIKINVEVNAQHSFVKVTKKEVAAEVKKGYVVYHNIVWDTDGAKVKLPKAVKIKKKHFDKDFIHEVQGADILSDNYGWCVESFEIN